MNARLRVDPIRCNGHGLCAELLPEVVRRDDWGYPVISDEPVPRGLVRLAKRACAACPDLALRLEEDEETRAPRKDALNASG